MQQQKPLKITIFINNDKKREREEETERDRERNQITNTSPIKIFANFYLLHFIFYNIFSLKC